MYGVRPRARLLRRRVQRAKHLGGSPAARHEGVRRQLGERLEREPALVETRMRHVETWLVQHEVTVEQQVEIDRARAPAFLVVAGAAEPALDVEQDVEQLAGREASLDGDGAVHVAGLLDRPPRLRLAQRRDADDRHVGQLAHERDGPSDRGLAVAQIRTEPDVGAHERTVACAAASGS